MPQARPPFITRQNLSTGTLILIITSVLLIIAGSGVLVYTTVSNQIATDQAQGTATAQTNATMLARVITNTASAEHNATALAQANATMTAQTRGTATALASATAVAQAHATATAQVNADATATAQAAVRNPYPPYSGTLVLNDPLNNNSQGHNWDVYGLPDTNDCQFVAGAYESTIHELSGIEGSNACFAENTNFTNFTFQVQVTVVKGSCGGVSFRGDSKAGNFYEFHVCSDGTYQLYNASMDLIGSPFAYGPFPAIHKGLGQTNAVAVVAIGDTITLYVNGQNITSVIISLYSHGQIGCEATEIDNSTMVMFRNAMVWTL